MSKAKNILVEAKRLSEESETWADLSNALFDPWDGLLARSFPEPAERAMFRKSDDCNKLYDFIEQKMKQTGVVKGSQPTKSGRFVVRLPRSLHVALEKEAAAEGTSLNQLVLAKLAVQLNSATRILSKN